MHSILEDVYDRSGVDLRPYRQGVLKRRLARVLEMEPKCSFAELARRLAATPEAVPKVVALLQTERVPFQAPAFYRAFRKKALPWLRTFPSLRVWVAGGGAAEAFCLAALLQEEEVPRHTIYVTEGSEAALEATRRGAFPRRLWKRAETLYREGGGKRKLALYGEAEGDEFHFDGELRRHMVFFAHHLPTDASFNEFQVIVGRYATLDFAKRLRQRVYQIFDESLARFGVVALGVHDSLAGTELDSSYRKLEPGSGLYKRGH